MSRLAAIALSAALYAAGCPPWSLDGLAPLALAPLLLALWGQRPGAAFGTGVAFALAASIGVSWWFPGMIARFFGVPLPLGALAAGAVYLLCVGLPIGLVSAGAARLLGAPRPLAYVGVPALWVAGELARTWLFTGIPWAFLGHVLYRRLTLIQIADVTGAYGLSFLCAATALALADLWRSLVGQGGRAALGMLALVAALWTAVHGYGRWRLAGWRAPAESMAVAIVQTNRPPARDVSFMARTATMQANVRLTRSGLDGYRPELVVWPENSAGFFLDRDPPALASLRTLARETGAVLLVGAPRRDAEQGELRNAAYAIGPANVLGTYDKVRLVPFAEYAPGHLRALGAQAAVLTPGPAARPVPHPRGPLGVMICYEVLYPRFARALVRHGARMLVNLSNDGWSHPVDPTAARQHLAAAVFRAVETRRSLVRAATTGISAVIEPTGASGPVLGTGVADVIRARVAIVDGLSPYVRFGDVFARLCVLAALGALAAASRRARA